MDAPKPTTASDKKRPATPRALRRPAFAWLAAAESVGAVAGGSLMATLGPSGNVTAPPTARPSAEDLAAAADLRRQAAAACEAKQWALCLADLDKARSADPDGDDAPATKTLRDRAVAAILARP